MCVGVRWNTTERLGPKCSGEQSGWINYQSIKLDLMVTEPFFVFCSKLAFQGISCDKSLTYLRDESCVLPCGSWHHFVDNFTFESIYLELFAFRRECSGLFTGRRSGL